MDYFVYILKSMRDGGYYIGTTEDIENRLRAHNEGLTRSTKGRRPLILIWYKGLPDKSAALRYEKFLKSSRGYKEKLSLIKSSDRDHEFE